MANQSDHQKTASEKDYMLALEIIAANTMCTRKAVGVAAKIGKTLIVSTTAVTVATIVLTSVPIDQHNNLWILATCWGVIVVFCLFAVIYSLVLLAELDHTTELVAKKEETFIHDDKNEED